jgi:hypothetical protein
MLFAIGCELLLIDILRIMKVPAPCRISSLPQGAPLRPGIYAYIEDICAVDGSGGTEFRQRLNLRYQASKEFREMLHRLTLFWAIGAIAMAGITVAIVFTIQRDAAYVVRIEIRLPILHNANSRRLVGLFPLSGLEYGPPSPSPGCRRASSTNTTHGPPRDGRHRKFLSARHDFFLFSISRIITRARFRRLWHVHGVGVWLQELSEQVLRSIIPAVFVHKGGTGRKFFVNIRTSFEYFRPRFRRVERAL